MPSCPKEMANTSKYARKVLGDDAAAAPGILFDDRRTRTAWFDGQHVVAEDFNRDQSYHLTRYADLGGMGVSGTHKSNLGVALDCGEDQIF